MAPLPPQRYRSIFSPATVQERHANFEHYWQFIQSKTGTLCETTRELSKKRATLHAFQAQVVRTCRPLPHAAAFYRNCLTWRETPALLPRQTLLLTALYKVAWHEWLGISSAWERTPSVAQARNLLDKITRYHLAEEFGHIRLFEELFRTVHVAQVVWHPPGPWHRRMYQGLFALPGWLLYAPAFVSELMGFVFYWEVDAQLEELWGDDPAACQRLRALLHAIMADELAHIGLRRNFLGPLAVQAAYGFVAPMIRLFFRAMPESRYVCDIARMVRHAQQFDYRGFAPTILSQSWVPSYCQVPTPEPPSAPRSST
jgi:hypothetical protein